MHHSLCVFIFCFFMVAFSSATYQEGKSMHYSVPKATIKVFPSKGFSVSIPDSPGLSLFAFHGKINSKLGLLEGGTFSKDVSQPVDGLWTFRDDATKLKVGDVINYWLFVEKDKLGYRQDLQTFVVEGKTISYIDINSFVFACKSFTVPSLWRRYFFLE